jgi:uncharacterized protein (TIGR00251 family)
MEIRERDGGVSFAVRVQPRASRTELAGEWQDALRVRLSAPPVDDKANEELRRFLAQCLKVPLAAVNIKTGRHGRTKYLEIRGVTAAQVRALSNTQGNVTT